MTRTIEWIVAWAVCLFVIVAGGCASNRPAWNAGVSREDLSPQSLKQLKQAKVEYVEVFLGSVMKLPADQRMARCEEIRRNAQKAGVTIWSVHIPFGKGWDISVTDANQRATAMKNVHEAMELCRVLAPQKAVIHASAEPIRDQERSARLQAARASLQQLTPEFAAMRIQLALEDLPRTCLGNTSDEILALTNGIEGLGVCFDTNHLLKETPEHFVRKVGPRIVTLHVSDYDGRDERHWMAGEGIINWPAVASALAETGYTGPFLFETSKHKDGRPIQPAEYTRFTQELPADIHMAGVNSR